MVVYLGDEVARCALGRWTRSTRRSWWRRGRAGTLKVARELVRCGHRALAIAAPGRLAQAIVEAGAEHVPWAVGEKARASRGRSPRGGRPYPGILPPRYDKPGQAPALGRPLERGGARANIST